MQGHDAGVPATALIRAGEADMDQRIDLRLVAGFAALLALAACSTPEAKPEAMADVVVTEASFRCIRDMQPVRGFFVDNLLGDVAATVKVAQSPTGGTYPPGSLVQVIPTTAMVKHRPGHNPETNDWEFIELDVRAGGATILGRGFAELNMRSGLNCFNCHKPAKAAWDLICNQTRDCVPIPLTPAMLRGLANTDPRCPKIELPKEQSDALAVLAARSRPAVTEK
jgi:hypothetical protein